jgi:hypothetical protein
MNTVSSEVLKTIGEILRRAFPQLQSNANVNSSPSGAGQPVSGVMVSSEICLRAGFIWVSRQRSAGKRSTAWFIGRPCVRSGGCDGGGCYSENDCKTATPQRCIHGICLYRGRNNRSAHLPGNTSSCANGLKLGPQSKERPRSRRVTMQLSDVRQPHCRQALRASQIGWHKPG